MSSMLRTLLRSTSDRQTDGSNKGSLSMPSSPSFSDFSMGVGQEESKLREKLLAGGLLCRPYVVETDPSNVT